MISIKINENESGQRLDRFLKKYLNKAPLSLIFKLIRSKIKVNGVKKKENYKLEIDDVLEINIDDIETLRDKKKVGGGTFVLKKDEIIFEDQNILIAKKGKGMLVHGDINEKKKTLQNKVLNYLISKNEYTNNEKTFTPSPVQRLDRNTEGMVVFAKNAKSLRTLNKMFKERGHIEKKYIAMVEGELREKIIAKGFIKNMPNKNMVKVKLNNEATSNNEDAKYVETIIEPKKVKSQGANKKTEVLITLITGRKHQIRATMKELKHPIIGDPKYGTGKVGDTQELTFYKLTIVEGIDDLQYLTGRSFEIKYN